MIRAPARVGSICCHRQTRRKTDRQADRQTDQRERARETVRLIDRRSCSRISSRNAHDPPECRKVDEQRGGDGGAKVVCALPTSVFERNERHHDSEAQSGRQSCRRVASSVVVVERWTWSLSLLLLLLFLLVDGIIKSFTELSQTVRDRLTD